MSQHWHVRVSGRAKRQPDIALLVRAVLALGEQLQREDDERRHARRDDRSITDEQEGESA